ncbi:MAG: trigger factor, partial [Mycoplasma sp.]
MKISKIEQLSNKVVCKIEVESNEWASTIENERKKAAKNVKVDGFRKGKVPPQVALKMVSPESVLIDAANTIINGSIKLVDKDEEINKLDAQVFPQPTVEVGKKFSTTEIEFDIVYWVMPKVSIENYKKLGVEIPTAKVTKEEVEAQIEEMLNREKMLSKKEGSISKGDQVKFDFVGSVDGVEFPGGKAENYELEIGSGQFIPG